MPLFTELFMFFFAFSALKFLMGQIESDFGKIAIVTFVFNGQNSVSCDPLCGPFWSEKYLKKGLKLLSGQGNISFLEIRYPEDTKNPYYVLSLEVRKKILLFHGRTYSRNLGQRPILARKSLFFLKKGLQCLF